MKRNGLLHIEHADASLLPIYLVFPLQVLKVLSCYISMFHLRLIKIRNNKISRTILDSPSGLKNTLKDIWFARLLRRSLSLITRTPLKFEVLKLVDNQLKLPSSGCVIAIPHTVWARLLAAWCRSNEYALVFAGGPWVQRTGHVNVPGRSVTGICQVVTHLKSNGIVVVISDNQNRQCFHKLSYLNKSYKASLLPVRLASLARVPIITVIPKFKENHIVLNNGIEINKDIILHDKKRAIEKIFNHFKMEIIADPSLYAGFILKSLDY